MNAYNVSAHAELSFSEKNNAKSIYFRFLSTHKKTSCKYYLNKEKHYVAFQIIMSPSKKTVNIYTVFGPYRNVSLDYSAFKNAIDSKKPIKVSLLNDHYELIEAVLPCAYVNWLSGDSTIDNIENNCISRSNDFFVINLINDEHLEKQKNVRNEIKYHKHSYRGNIDYDHHYDYGFV